jgi:hypothetical protein
MMLLMMTILSPVVASEFHWQDMLGNDGGKWGRREVVARSYYDIHRIDPGRCIQRQALKIDFSSRYLGYRIVPCLDTTVIRITHSTMVGKDSL